MRLLLRSALGGAACAAAVIALLLVLRHDALAGQARQAHESLTVYLGMGGAALGVVLTVVLAAAGSLVRWRRSRRPRVLGGSKLVSW